MSLQDLNVSQKVKDIAEEIISRAEKKTQEIISDYELGKLETLPGQTPEKTRETKILQILNEHVYI